MSEGRKANGGQVELTIADCGLRIKKVLKSEIRIPKLPILKTWLGYRKQEKYPANRSTARLPLRFSFSNFSRQQTQKTLFS